MTSPPDDKDIKFIMRHAAALHHYGAAAHSLEAAMTNVSAALGLYAEFFCVPTMIMASFTNSDDVSRQALRRVKPATVDLKKLLELDALGDELIEKKIDLGIAIEKLKEITSADENHFLLDLFAFMFCSFSASIFLGAGQIEALVALLAGLIVGFVNYLTSLNESTNRFSEFFSSFITTIFTSAVFLFSPNFSIQLVILASLIVIVPGLGVTIAMTELATQNLVSGTVRLMSSFLIFFKMIFGVGLAYGLMLHFYPQLHYVEVIEPLSDFYKWLVLPFAAIAFMITFRGRWKDTHWIVLVTVLGFSVSSFVAEAVSPLFAAFVASLTVAVFSNAYARLAKHPAATVLLPGLILMVPGSIGLKGLSMLIEKNTLLGIDTAFQMFLVAVALVGGLLLANVIVPPRRSL